MAAMSPNEAQYPFDCLQPRNVDIQNTSGRSALLPTLRGRAQPPPRSARLRASFSPSVCLAWPSYNPGSELRSNTCFVGLRRSLAGVVSQR
jgi:hypothetical protein